MIENNIMRNDELLAKLYKYINSYKQFRKEEKNRYIMLFEAMAIGTFVAISVEGTLWNKYAGVTHSILELICIVFNMSLFFIVWNKYEDSPVSSKLIAFGFLATTIFDIMHIYHFLPLGLVTEEHSHFARRFWVLGRFTEISMIFIASWEFKNKKIKLKRLVGLSISVLLPLIISYLLIEFHHILPRLYDENRLTIDKIILELGVVILAIVSLLRYKNKIKERGYISYKYLALALTIMIPTEICFMLFRTYNSSTFVYGHVLKIIYCYFLHKSIFKGSIEYTYNELEQSKRRLKDILDAIPIGIETYDSNLKLDFANKEVERLLHCKREEIIGLSTKEIFQMFKSKDDYLSMLEQGKDKNEGINNVIISAERRNGEEIQLYFNSQKLEDGVLLVLKDAGREQEIENLHIQTYTILNSMKSPAFICDNDYNIISVNKSFEELVGLPSEYIVNKNTRELLQSMKFCTKNLSRSENTSGSHSEDLEASLINTRGEKKEIILHTSKILNIYENTIGAIAVITDLTDLKEKQEKILHNEKLALLGQMGAAIVHETRNFLTTIKGCSQLIEAITTQDKVTEYAKKINVNTDEVNLIMSDFLSLSKPKQAITEEIAACDLLQSIENTIKTSCLIKGVCIEFINQVDERYLQCDEIHMTQVVLNICKNAVEAMEETSNAKLRIEAGIKEDINALYIKISDNGKGMNKETLSKIGTAFFTTKGSGTGLGLSVCYDIVKQHGGWIDVTSEEGEGSTFIINIPMIEENDLEEVI